MKESPTPVLSVIIPTWNGWALLESCLDSLRRQTFQDMEIIVVDDGSTDGTPERLADRFPEVRCILSPANRGFAPTVNLGLAEARAPWVFLLNNDVTLEARCVEKLMECAREETYSMIAPLVLCAESPELIYSAGDALGVSGRPTSRGFRCARACWTSKGEPFGVSGGYGLFRKALLDAIGPLDEAFVAYFEDADLCFRARWAGHRATVVMGAEAWHVGGASIGGRTWWRTRQCFQNHALLVVKNFSLSLLWGNRRALLRERRHQWGRIFGAARNEWGSARAVAFCLGAWWGLLVRLPGALRHRRAILRGRVLGDSAMQALLETGDSHEGL